LDRRDEQLAANEALFRDVNETVAEVATTTADPILFLCECADEFCAESIALTIAQYEQVRAVPEHFIVKPGHDRPDVERIVEQRRDYWIVEKFGEAAEVAEETDPRS
jgi:hypothetical protein